MPTKNTSTAMTGQSTNDTARAASGCSNPCTPMFHPTASSRMQYRLRRLSSGQSRSYTSIMYRCNVTVMNGIQSGAVSASARLDALTARQSSGNSTRMTSVPRNPFMKWRVIPFPMKPVSGSVSKWVRALEMCRHSSISRENMVGVMLVLRGKRVPFTCDSSRSAMKGFLQKSARRPSGLHQGTITPSRNMMFHVHVQVRWKRFSRRHMGQRVLVERINSFSTRNTGWLGSERGVTIEVACWHVTVGITSEWPWKLRRMIHDLGDQIRQAHWKLRNADQYGQGAPHRILREQAQIDVLALGRYVQVRDRLRLVAVDVELFHRGPAQLVAHLDQTLQQRPDGVCNGKEVAGETSLGSNDDEARRKGEIAQQRVARPLGALLQKLRQPPTVHLTRKVQARHLELTAMKEKLLRDRLDVLDKLLHFRRCTDQVDLKVDRFLLWWEQGGWAHQHRPFRSRTI
uniref:Uncharacterized protein n=1 Tax=Anopheles atroparvus TaxID=41427 RepID=A0A182J441_ANOAO